MTEFDSGVHTAQSSYAVDVKIIWIFFFGISFLHEIAEIATRSIFLQEFGKQGLLNLYIYRACLDIPIAFLYINSVSRRRTNNYLPVILLLFCIVVLALPWLRKISPRFTVFFSYLGVLTLGKLLTVEWGAYILGAIDPSVTRKAVPRIYTAAVIGSGAGGSIHAAFASSLGLSFLLTSTSVMAFCLALSIITANRRMPAYAPSNAGITANTGGAGEVPPWKHEQIRVFFLFIVLSTFFMAILRIVLNYQCNLIFKEAFALEEQRSQFFGYYSTLSNTIVLAIQFLIAPAVLSRGRVAQANAFYAVCLLSSAVFLGIAPILPVAVLGRFFDKEGKTALKTPISVLFYGPMSPKGRRLARSFIIGIVSPLGAVVAAVLLYYSSGMGSLTIPIFASVAGMLFVISSIIQGKKYNDVSKTNADC